MKSSSNLNTADAKASTNDIKVFGNPDEWQLITKASSENEGWMKSTKAMTVAGGVTLQVTSEFRENGKVTACAEALQFIPGAKIDIEADGRKRIV